MFGLEAALAVVFSSIQLSGFLSYGPESEPIPLKDVNLLLGPNGAGKSNLVEALEVLRAAPGDLPAPIRQGGGVHEWVWKGEMPGSNNKCRLEVIAAPGMVSKSTHRVTGQSPAVRYTLVFGPEGDHFSVIDERLENEAPIEANQQPYFYFGYENGIPYLNQREGGNRRQLRREDIDRSQSILSQRRDPDAYPELARLSAILSTIRIYRNWAFGPTAPIRRACAADARTDRLEEAMDNLPARIGALRRNPANKRRLQQLVTQIADGYEDIDLVPEGGQLVLYLTEGAQSFPARRLSDGTLRMLALGAILIDPVPDSIIVIEEPELGLHPDLMPTVRGLVQSAAETAQIILTSHSTVLADAFTAYPESVVMIEKTDGNSTFRRLSTDDVDDLDDDGKGRGIGSLWMAGRLGGTRW